MHPNINRSIRAILWDMDGVLIDSGESHYRTWQAVFDTLRVPFNRERFRDTFGMNNASILKIILGDQLDPAEAERLSRDKESIWRTTISESVRLLPGVRACLEHFQALGLRQAVASSAPPENIEAVVDALEIRAYFDALAAGGNMRGKPAPDVFLHAAGLLQAAPAECLVLEDSLAGIQAARSAGMRCIAIANTYPSEMLTDAERVLDSLEDWEDRFLEE